MPLKIVQKDLSEIVGRGPVLLSVPPENSQELYTGQIGEEVALLSKAHAIISRAPRSNLDPNSIAQTRSEFETSMKKFLEDVRVECIVALFGRNDPGIEIRASDESRLTDEIVRLIKQTLGTGLDLRPGTEGPGRLSQESSKVTTLWVGLGPDERGFQKDAIVSKLADVVGMISRRFGGLEGDERSGDVLN